MSVDSIVFGLDPLGYQQISGLSSAVGFTIPSGASVAVVVPQTQAVRWRDDGTDPSATVGMPIAVAERYVFDHAKLPKVKFFEQAASAVLNVSYYGRLST